MGELTLKDLTVGYGDEAVIEGLDLEVADGEMVSILGPSGAGKTTILKAVAGLVKPARGEIIINGKSMNNVPAEQRAAVMVFQKPLLFPFMDVFQNVGFGLRMRGPIGRDEEKRIERILELTRLTSMGRRKVHELSGGQQQRVSLARALVLKPAILLLDEPLSSLDANLRQEMRELIKHVQAETRITTLLVTHDQAEALMISHRVGLLMGGRLRQVGPPRELFNRPRDPEVAEFFGGTNIIKGRIEDGRLHTEFGEFPAAPNAVDDDDVICALRPEDVILKCGQGDGLGGRVRRISFEGALTRVWVEVKGSELVALTPDEGLEPGAEVWVAIPPDKLWLFPQGVDE